VTYLEELARDFRRVLTAHADLLVIAVTATLALTVSYYHGLRIPWFGPELRQGFEILGRGLFFLLLPLASILLLRIPLKELGFSWGEPRKWLRDVALLYLVMLPLLFLVSRQPDFQQAYPYFRFAAKGWRWFLLAQLIQIAFMFCWEFLTRGYLLFGFYRKLGPIAVAIQMIPFVLLHSGKPELETYGSIVAGLVLGVVALRARSFYPCVLLHFAVAATLDVLSVVRF
jgi:hypothetical protein